MEYADPAVAERTRPPLVAVLGSPPYLLLWTAQFASLVAGFFNYVAVAWLVLQLTGSTLAVGSVLAAASIPTALFMLLGGAISDRYSPRATMLLAGLVRGLVMALVAALTLAHLVQFWELLAAAVLVGTTTAFFVPASTSMVPRLVAPDQLPAGNALLNLSRTVAMVMGSASAGVVVAAVGAGTGLAVDAGASALAALLVVPLPVAARPTSGTHATLGAPVGSGSSAGGVTGGVATEVWGEVATEVAGEAGRATANTSASRSTLGDIRDGLAYAWRDAQLRFTLLVVAVLNFGAMGAIEVGLPALAHARLSEGAAALGVTFAAWGIGSTAGSLFAGTRPLPARFGWFMVVTVAFMGVGVAAIGLAPTLPALVAVMVLLGLVEGVATTYLLSWMQARTDSAMQGRVMAIAMLASVGLEPIALAAAGAVAAHSLGLLFWASAAIVEITAVGASLSPSVRRM